jgi:class 3 adenylate cyclase/dihydrofolate reductase
MRRLIAQEFMTLDGVMEAPGLEEHIQGRNGWALLLSDAEMQRYNLELFNRCDAILLGRVTYQIWEIWWPTANDAAGFATRVNAMPKYVVSNTLASVDWDNTTILRGDLRENVTNLKAQEGGDILLNGSADLLAALLDLRLIDEFRILVFPLVLGSGKRLFRDNIDSTHLRLTDTQTFSSGVVLLTYEPREAPDPSRYLADYAWTNEQILSLQAAQDVDRVLATVLFTDIVDSTGRAAELGDRQWRRLLDRHDELARKEVARWHGELVKTTGDGILATFAAPTRALRCAFALRSSLGNAGIKIRTGIHTGEIERREGDIGGIGVHIASRALAEAGSQDIVVTQPVRDLATGTDLVFERLGSVGLRGVPGEWSLFTARTA